jgi:GntR family carbon starvation induced transcriptional regulator
MALSLAIERGGENWQTEIVTQLYKLTLIEISSDPISYDQWAERNYHFHVALIAGCNSPILLDIRRTVYLKFDRYCRMPFQIGKKEFISNHQEHEQLVDAVLTRDVKRATDLMHHHINDSLEDVITQFKKNGLI